MTTDQETYIPPEHGWTCFHCGETFTHETTARSHFGTTPDAESGCILRMQDGERSLLRKIRAMEAELARCRNEDSDTDRAMHAMRADHTQALIRAEENGYARGLADGRKSRTSD